jgi:hypothetical protein
VLFAAEARKAPVFKHLHNGDTGKRHTASDDDDDDDEMMMMMVMMMSGVDCCSDMQGDVPTAVETQQMENVQRDMSRRLAMSYRIGSWSGPRESLAKGLMTSSSSLPPALVGSWFIGMKGLSESETSLLEMATKPIKFSSASLVYASKEV